MTDSNRPESENNDSEINARNDAQSRETTSDYSDTEAASAEQPHKSRTLNRGLIAAETPHFPASEAGWFPAY